jgi:hypothetical protein
MRRMTASVDIKAARLLASARPAIDGRGEGGAVTKKSAAHEERRSFP